MKKLSTFLNKKSLRNGQLRNEKGQGMAEYIIIVILVAIIVLVAIRLFGESVYNQFENATGQVDELQDG